MADNSDVSVEDAKKLLDQTPEHELDPHEDDAFFLDVLHPALTADEPQEDLSEAPKVLDFAHRQRLAQRMRLMAPRYARLRQLKAKRMAPNDRILYRARKAALNSLRKRVGGKLGEQYNSLSRQQKIQIDTMVLERYGTRLHDVVNRLAQRLLPKVRKKEVQRVQAARLVSEKQVERVNFGNRPSIDQNGADDPLHFPTYPQTIKRQEIYRGKFLKPDAKGENAPEADETEDTTGEFRLFGPTRKKPTINTETPTGDLGRKQRMRDVTEARKSASGAGGDEISNRHIMDHLTRAMQDQEYKIPWTNAAPSNIDPETARSAMSVYDSMLKRPGKPETKLAVTRRMAHSPSELKAATGFLKSALREETDPVQVKSMAKINANGKAEIQPEFPAPPSNSKGPARVGIQEVKTRAQLSAELSGARTPKPAPKQDLVGPPKKAGAHPRRTLQVREQSYGSRVREIISEASQESEIPYSELYNVYLNGTEEGNTEHALDAVFDYINEQQISVRRFDPASGGYVYKTVNRTAIRRKKKSVGYSGAREREKITRKRRARRYMNEGVEVGTDDSVLTYAAATPGQDSVNGYTRAEFSDEYPEVDLKDYANRDTGKSDNTYWQKISDAIKGRR